MTAAGVAEELGREIAEELPAELADRVSSEVRWEIPVVTDDSAARGGAGTEVIDAAHGRVLGEDWHLGVVLTDLPLRIGRRPVVADASATHGVAVVSLPALGAVQMRRRARDAVVRLVDGLVGESLELGRREGGERRRRVRRRLDEIARAERTLRPDDDDVDIRLVAAVVRGNARLLAGMLRANRPMAADRKTLPRACRSGSRGRVRARDGRSVAPGGRAQLVEAGRAEPHLDDGRRRLPDSRPRSVEAPAGGHGSRAGDPLQRRHHPDAGDRCRVAVLRAVRDHPGGWGADAPAACRVGVEGPTWASPPTSGSPG